MTPRLLTYQQAAEALNVSPKTIARRVKTGALAVVVDGGLRRIPEQALAQYVRTRTVPARGQREASRRPSPAATTARVGAAGDAGSRGRVRRLWEDAEPNETGGAAR